MKGLHLYQLMCVKTLFMFHLVPPRTYFIPAHASSLSISILWACMSLTDGVAVATASRMGSNSWWCSPAGLCLVSICWGLKRGRKETERPCRQKDRMGEQEEESGRTWLAALTLIEAREIGGWVGGGGCGGGGGGIDTNARIFYIICNIKRRGGLNNQISTHIPMFAIGHILFWNSITTYVRRLRDRKDAVWSPLNEKKKMFHLLEKR